MRFLTFVLMVPVLLCTYSAEAARISFATRECGTPPLLGLQFEVVAADTPTGVTVTGGTESCRDVAVGSLVDPTGTTPLYGDTIESIEFLISSPTTLAANSIDLGGNSLFAELRFTPTTSGGTLTAFFDPSIFILCRGSSTDDSRLCLPSDLTILPEEFDIGTTFKVTAVNDIAFVPEPATLTLLGLGLGAAAVRRRRATASARKIQPRL